MRDQTTTLLPRGEAYLMKDALDRDLNNIKETSSASLASARSRLDKLEGLGKGVGESWGVVVVVVGIILTIATVWHDFHIPM